MVAADENATLRSRLLKARKKEKASKMYSGAMGSLAPVAEDRRGEYEAEEGLGEGGVQEGSVEGNMVKADCDAPMGAGPTSARQAAISVAGTTICEVLNMASAEALHNSGETPIPV